MATYEKVSDKAIKEIKESTVEFDIDNIENRIILCDRRIANATVSKARWELLKSEAGKLGVTKKEK